jgi:hypothetical protein
MFSIQVNQKANKLSTNVFRYIWVTLISLRLINSRDIIAMNQCIYRLSGCVENVTISSIVFIVEQRVRCVSK